MKAEYVAGFLDGEGCFLLGTGITVKVSHTHRPTLELMRNKYGGTIREHNSPSHKKQAWVWAVHGSDAAFLCWDILPFLIEKQPQAEKLLQYQETIGPRGRTISEETKQLRQKLKETLRESRVH